MGALLVANRGEIALRIMRSAGDMTTIAVAPSDDAGSLHVAAADRSVELPGRGAGAYLDTGAVVAAAVAANATHLHPGYGFLSEDPALADACDAAGIVFVGPTSDTLRTFGDKTAARALAQ